MLANGLTGTTRVGISRERAVAKLYKEIARERNVRVLGVVVRNRRAGSPYSP